MVCRVGSHMLGKGSSLQLAIDIFFNSFTSTDKTKNTTNGTVVATRSCIVWHLWDCKEGYREFKWEQHEVQKLSMWEFLRWWLKWIWTQMFSMDENLIDVCFLSVTSHVIFPRTKWSRKIWQPCDVRVIAISIVPDNTLLRRLRVLHLKKFWLFCPIDKNRVLPR